MTDGKHSKQSLDSAIRENDSSKEKNGKKSKVEKRKPRSCSKSKSRSPKHKSDNPEIDHDIPDRSFGDLFCHACDSHMNNEDMWESHIKGRRHMKNTRSGAPVDQKYEYLDEDPIIKSEIDADTRPIIGLEHVCEIRRLEQMPIYSCFLCSATLPNAQRLIEHTLTLKHRHAYIKEHIPDEAAMIQSTQLKKCYLETIVEGCIQSLEKDHGRGKMIVKKEKNKTASSSYEKGYSSDYDSHSDHKYSRHGKSSNSEWKRVSSLRYYESEQHSSEYRLDFDIDHYYSKEEPQSRSVYYRKAPGKKASPSKSVRNISSSSHLWTDEHEKVDLRNILQQKKSPRTSCSAINNNSNSVAGSTTIASSVTGSIAIPSSASLPPSSSITNISDSMLKFINDLSPEVFFHLALFKLDNMEIHNEKDVKLLDRLISRATAMSCDIKKNKIFPSLQAKFHESMVQNDFYPQSNVDFDQNLDNLIQHYKFQKSLDTSHNQFQNSGVPDRSNFVLSQSNSNYHPAQLNTDNYSRSFTPSANTSALSSTSSDYTGNQSSNLIPFKGFSSTPSSIPGFIFGEEINSQPENPATQINQLRSPFEHFSENDKNILGYFNSL